MKRIKKSNFLSLEWKDGIRALILAVITSVLTSVVEVLEKDSLDINWKRVATIALVAACSYVLKNWLTNSSDEFMKKEK